MSKYKYYFKKPKSEIVIDILEMLTIAGLLVIAGQSPYFVRNLCKSYKKFKKYKSNKINDTFYRLRKRGDIVFENRGSQLYISLTNRGKRKAGWMQIDAIKLKKPKKWDGKWRIAMFDIAHFKKLYREVLRGKLKDLGFQLLQKSVWVVPYPCEDEIELIKSFFGLTDKEIRTITANNIGNDEKIRKIFNL